MPLEKTTKMSNVLVGLVAKITFLFWCFTDIHLSKQHENFELRNRSRQWPCIKRFSTSIFFIFKKKTVSKERDSKSIYYNTAIILSFKRSMDCMQSFKWALLFAAQTWTFLQNYDCWQFATVADQRKIHFDTDLLFLDVDNVIVLKSSKSLINTHPFTYEPRWKY